MHTPFTTLKVTYQALTHNRNNPIIRLNFEDVPALDEMIVEGYREWVEDAPEPWKADGFLTKNLPIIVTSCFSQNMAIMLLGNEEEEAAMWNLEQDYLKIVYLTIVLATLIE